MSLAQRGLSYGVHVVITAARWSEIRMNLRDLLGTRFELRLGDPGDSEIDRRAAMNVPDRSPGRGITPGKLHFLSAVPRVDGSSTVDDLADGVANLVGAVRGAWNGPVPPRVRLLPRQLPASGLPAADRPHTYPVGLNESALAPVYLDFAAEPHLLVLGDSGAGKTNVLRLLARQIVARYRPEEARLIIGDYRRSLLGVVETEHLLELAPSAPALQAAMGETAAALRQRLPGPDVTTEELRTRSWWAGPDLYLLVDDYDLVAGVGGNPLAELAEFLPQARDIGLHVIVARRVGGASRAMYEPVLQRMRELDNPALLMSGNPEEGPLLGNLRPSNLPPGRGMLVRRSDGSQLIQVALSE
jgi:S-DNA-T family DNA segregation ATPase FtsK/SpoIIIE